jgi:sugar/nucleoside kinase (ribokinase family)
MASVARPKAFGAGLIALDLVVGMDPATPVRSWAGGTCGNVLSILSFLGWDTYPIARMNGDPASDRVRADMTRWGVHLDFVSCGPTAHTPIIIQEIRRGRDGKPKHRFSWSCPKCGQWLPGFKAVTTAAVETVTPTLKNASVFFLDRLSRAALTLASQAAKQGAVVVFEPSGRATDKLFAEATQLAHVVKYADQRLANVRGVMQSGSATLVEVQTLGDRGLKYRHRLGRGVSDWLHLSAVPAPRLADSCGSGDWVTAGLVAKVASGGQVGLRQGGAQGVRTSLRYGQALAAWNCGFEGARGGMYAVTRKVFEEQITALLAGQLDKVMNNAIESKAERLVDVDCPACLPKSKRRPVASNRTTRAAA